MASYSSMTPIISFGVSVPCHHLTRQPVEGWMTFAWPTPPERVITWIIEHESDRESRSSVDSATSRRVIAGVDATEHSPLKVECVFFLSDPTATIDWWFYCRHHGTDSESGRTESMQSLHPARLSNKKRSDALQRNKPFFLVSQLETRNKVLYSL